MVDGGVAVSAIRVLPDHVINQIAAGEVIDRPASVVRELVDNAIDAGATSIDIEVRGGGKQLIQVRDNGTGIAASDLPLAVARHATSKLATVADLVGLGTLGFRGEALASIASVARVAVRSRPQIQPDAYELTVDGGRLGEARVVPGSAGTRIEVRDLLFNVPARQKFLRSDGSELGHVLDTVTRIAVAHPATSFTVSQAGRVLLQVPAAASRLQRLRALWPSHATPLGEQTATVEGVRATVFVAAVDMPQPTSKWIWLFAGQRPIRDRNVLHAVLMGHGDRLGPGQYPVACVVIDAPDGAVDINVHPQKQEVRFANVNAVTAAVRTAIRNVLQEHIPRPVWTEGPATRVAERLAELAANSRLITGRSATRRIPPNNERASEPARDAWQDRRSLNVPTPQVPHTIERDATLKATASRQLADNIASLLTRENSTPQGLVSGFRDRYFANLRYLGQLFGRYWICEGQGEMVILDQCRVGELLQQSQYGWPVERLLIPIPLQVSPRAQTWLGANVATLARLGYALEQDDDSWLLRAYPRCPGGDACNVLTLAIQRAAASETVDVAALLRAESTWTEGEPIAEEDVLSALAALDAVNVPAHLVVRLDRQSVAAFWSVQDVR